MFNRTTQTLAIVALAASAAFASPYENSRGKNGELQMTYSGPKVTVARLATHVAGPRTTHWVPPVAAVAPVFHNGSNAVVTNHSASGNFAGSFAPVNYTPLSFTAPSYSPNTYSPAVFTPANYTPNTYTPLSPSIATSTPAVYTPNTYTPPTYTAPNQ